MISTKVITLPEIGDVKITKRHGSRRLSISVNRQKNVQVSIPFRLGFSEGEKFLLEKLDWVKSSISKIESLKQKDHQIFNEEINLLTRSRRFVIKKWNNGTFKLRVLSDTFIIFYPETRDVQTAENQKIVQSLIIKALRFEAKEYLPVRVKELAQLHHLTYHDVKIKQATSRWGSCSVKNNINLNLFLVMLPDALSDYVILHELAHTVHKNHGERFWQLLEQISGQAREKSQKLRAYNLTSLLP